MTSPFVECRVCGDMLIVVPDGRGFPPDLAKRRLAKRCSAKGHKCDPQYRAGISFGLTARGMSGDAS